MSATPILDREQAAPKPKRFSWVSLAAGAGLGVILSVLLILGDDLGFISGDATFPFLLGFCAAFVVCVLVHELGHWAAGAWVGFEFRWIVAGPLMLAKESRRYRFRFMPGHLLGGGMTAMVPPSEVGLRRRFAVFASGGPAATALVFVVILLLPHGLPATCLLVANLIIAIFSWLPLTVKSNPTDAKLLLLLSRNGPSSERLAAILYLTALDTGGVVPGQWPAHSVSSLDSAPDDATLRAGGYWLLYVHARDGGDPAVFTAVLERVLAASAEMRADLRRAAFSEAAFCQGVFAGNSGIARAWLDDARKVKGAVPRPDWDASALAAIAWAERNPAEAQSQLTRALAFLDRHPGTSGSIAAARARLLKLRNETDDLASRSARAGAV